MTWLPETKSVPALRDWAGMTIEDEPHLSALVARVRKDKPLAALLEKGATLLYEKDDQGQFSDMTEWQPPAFEEAGLCLLLAIAALASIRVAHALRHVDSSITRATCRDIGIVVERWKSVYATPEQPIGLERSLLPWFRLLSSGELYRLGRLEFVRGTFHGPVAVYREKATGKLALFAGEGTLFDSDGYITEIDAPGVWNSRLAESNTTVTGNIISPLGLGTREEQTLALTDWEPFLKSGDSILEVHIPQGEPLDKSVCEESLTAARAFFPKTYPNVAQPVAFVCSSWLLDPAWQERLESTTNIVQFQTLGTLFPVSSGRREGLYYVFGHNSPDPQNAPRDTYLRQIMLKVWESGEPLRSGGLLIPF